MMVKCLLALGRNAEAEQVAKADPGLAADEFRCGALSVSSA